MQEYLQYAKPGTSIVNELKSAFEGNGDEYELVEERKIKTSNLEPEFTYKLKKVGYKPKPIETA